MATKKYELQGNMILPKGKEVVIGKDGWFQLKNKGEEIEEEKPLEQYCYFCDFNELTTHKHHIIRKCDGGKDTKVNKIPLCPNHHELIHKRKYILYFSKGFYYLKELYGEKMIHPTNRQKDYPRENPINLIKDNENFKVIKGEDSIIRVCIKDFYKRARKKNSIYRRNIIKNLKKGVQYGSVQS